MSPLASAMLGDPQRTPPLASMVMANPVGTERIDQSLTNPTPGFQPAVDWGGYTVSRPLSDTAHAAINNAMGWMAPIKAFHGSPHDFSAFDMSKIGTGEGAQAYGRGLYFAGNEPTAAYYRQSLSGGGVDVVRNGQSVGQIPGTNIVNDPKFVDAYRSLIPADVPDWIKSGVLRDIRGAGDAGQNVDLSAARQASLARLERDRLSAGTPAFHQQAADAINKAYDSIGGDVQFRAPGRMYEVNLNVEPGQLLDWDKPLSEQSPQVLALAQNHGVPNALPDIGKPSLTATVPPTGRDAYEYAAGRLGDSGLAAQQMRDAGIPGIQYLDAGSRAAGDGTRNYVMFDPNLIDIVRKYGLAGAMLGAPAAAPFMQQQAPQQ